LGSLQRRSATDTVISPPNGGNPVSGHDEQGLG
jgi:hypothetical protein